MTDPRTYRKRKDCLLNQGKQVAVPHSHHNTMMWVDESKIKPPKLRFKPGMIFVYQGEIILVQAAFRLRDSDREWRYYCSVISRKVDDDAKRYALERTAHYVADAADTVVVYWLFRNSLDAITYFGWLPRFGDGRVLNNKDLIQKGERLVPEVA